MVRRCCLVSFPFSKELFQPINKVYHFAYLISLEEPIIAINSEFAKLNSDLAAMYVYFASA